MKSGPAPEIFEIIEIIDDDFDIDSRGARHTTPQAIPETGRRWAGPVAAAILVAIIGFGVVTSANSSGASKAKPVPTSIPVTTTATTTTAPAPAVNLVSPQFYVANPTPAGFAMHFAETLGMGGNTADFTDTTTAQLWASDGATATSGTWFEVSRGTHHATGRNSYRTLAGDVIVVVEHDPASGQSRLSFTKDDESLEITAFGWADRQLLRLVESVWIANSKIQFTDPFFLTDHKLVLEADPPSALYGLPVAWVGYTTALPAALAAQSFTITVAGYPTTNRDVAVRFALTDVSAITVGDLAGIVGRLAADPRQVIVQWRDGDRLISVRGNLPLVPLVAIAQTVQAAPDDAVNEVVDSSAPSIPPALDAQPHTVGSGWLGGPWIVQVSTTSPTDPAEWFVWWIGQPGATSAPTEARLSITDPGPSIETLVEHGRTYVLAKVPRSMAGATLHVNRNGQPPVELALRDVDAGLTDEFAAYAFAEPVPFTAQIVDATGQTVSSWPVT
ncbi:MAG: hypothetical protein ACXVLM_10835 [Ilumatobacteraceae bacterium]